MKTTRTSWLHSLAAISLVTVTAGAQTHDSASEWA